LGSLFSPGFLKIPRGASGSGVGVGEGDLLSYFVSTQEKGSFTSSSSGLRGKYPVSLLFK
jgi:hypothetical protein